MSPVLIISGSLGPKTRGEHQRYSLLQAGVFVFAFALDASDPQNLSEAVSVSSRGAAVLLNDHLLSRAVAGRASKSNPSRHAEMQRFLKTPEVKARYSLNFLRY